MPAFLGSINSTPANGFRDRGYNDGFARRPKLAAFEKPEYRAAYVRGYRLGARDRVRHDREVEASRA